VWAIKGAMRVSVCGQGGLCKGLGDHLCCLGGVYRAYTAQALYGDYTQGLQSRDLHHPPHTHHHSLQRAAISRVFTADQRTRHSGDGGSRGHTRVGCAGGGIGCTGGMGCGCMVRGVGGRGYGGALVEV
jgi:hypothetical protein